MDRQSIERRDFPIARRGYEIEAVDAHLAKLADEHEALARRGRPQSPGGLATAAAEQVRMIVEAAEQSAQDIGREAELEARQLRQDAREEAERMRTDAGRQAREHVARVAEVALGLLERVEGMDRELNSLLEGLRGGGQRLAADLSLLQASVEEVRAATHADSTQASDGRPGDETSDGVAPDGEDRLSTGAGEARDAGDPGRAFPDEAGYEPEPSLDAVPDCAEAAEVVPGDPDDLAEAGGSDYDARQAEADGARMVALNMALNGVPREKTRGHLEENFSVDGLDQLLDDVYARAGE